MKQNLKKMMSVLILTMSISKSFAETSLPVPNKSELEMIIMLAGGDLNKVPIEEDPGPDAEVLLKVIHEKQIVVDKDSVSFKWTHLGYGAETEKVLVPELSNHTVFNHRNPGEGGPCLRSFRSRISFDPVANIVVTRELPVPSVDLLIDVQILNQYEINRIKKVCRVSMIEEVKTMIDGIEFIHTYSKPMGFRYIEDCL